MNDEELEQQALNDKTPSCGQMHDSKYKVFRTKGSVLIGMCDDYEGFMTCVKADSVNKDISFPHNEDMTDFCCKDANDRVLYYPNSLPNPHVANVDTSSHPCGWEDGLFFYGLCLSHTRGKQ